MVSGYVSVYMDRINRLKLVSIEYIIMIQIKKRYGRFYVG